MRILSALIFSFVFVHFKLFARAQLISLGERAGIQKFANPDDPGGKFFSVGGVFNVPDASDVPGTAAFVGVTFGGGQFCGGISLSVGVFIYNFNDRTSGVRKTSYRPAYQLYPEMMHIIIEEDIFPISPGDPIMISIIAPDGIPTIVLIINRERSHAWEKSISVPLREEWGTVLCDQVVEWEVGTITAQGVPYIPLPRFGEVNIRRAQVVTAGGDTIPAGHNSRAITLKQNDQIVVQAMINPDDASLVEIKQV